MSVGRLDLLPQMFTRVDVFLFHAFSALVWLGIVAALAFMFRMLWPVCYEVLPPMTGFLEWRDDYARQLREARYAADVAQSLADDRMLLELSRCVRHATEVNFDVNMLKQQAFNRCVRVLAATTATLGLALLSSRILMVQGI